MALRTRSSRPHITNTAFFCCDVQERFRPIITNMSTVIHVSKMMNEAAGILQVPLIVSEQYPRALGHAVEELQESFKMFNETKDVAPPLFKVFEKTKFSMLNDEIGFNEGQKLEGLSHVVLYGIESHVCIQQTAEDLLENGVSVSIVADGVSAQRKFDRDIALKYLASQGARITTSESVLFEMMGDARHPNFKQISALCKKPRPELTDALEY
eukprot:gb/GECH01011960.1/.p1 GENE.gb/GECH01011960.1/~~gb/GECH01011960.1/.p1  ORF type:complete len:212 (+),score=64.68 gb/GECH01011960.1/:1-636(+)